MLENYFTSTGKGVLLSFTNKSLDANQFRLISNALVDFAIDAYGYEGITPTRKKMIACAAVSLFPGMKFIESTGDGTVNFI